MLVLSRRPGQRVELPTLGITVQVLQATGKAVRLGIEAPPDVPILREELTPDKAAVLAPAPKAAGWDHDQRGRLNTAMMALYLAEAQFQAGHPGDAETTLGKALRLLEALEGEASRRAEAARAKGIGALLVEDDRNEGTLLASYLRMAGIRTDTVHDGEEALAFLASRDRPDFVLLDMRLPGRDGPSILSAIRQNEALRGLRVFAVTGSSADELGVATGPAGVDGWFRKPLNPARLVEAMRGVFPNN